MAAWVMQKWPQGNVKSKGTNEAQHLSDTSRIHRTIKEKEYFKVGRDLVMLR